MKYIKLRYSLVLIAIIILFHKVNYLEKELNEARERELCSMILVYLVTGGAYGIEPDGIATLQMCAEAPNTP